MKIGIDFGTSYSCAAVYVNNSLEFIQFGDQSQFRTAAYFPAHYVDPAQFKLTPLIQNDIDRYIGDELKNYKTRENTYNEAIRTLLAEEAQAARSGNPFSDEEKAQRRRLYSKPSQRSRAEYEKSALLMAKRQWIAAQKDQLEQRGPNFENAIFGESAIDEFFLQGDGRIVQSPKSMLGYKHANPAVRQALLSILTEILAHIRAVASAQIGCEVTQAILGKPVEFKSSMGPEGSRQAEALLQEAAAKAGFLKVEFLLEPSAAAFGYHRICPEQCTALVIDIGGGTTDIALAEVGGNGKAPTIHGTWGTPKGGTDVDLGLSLRLFMPLFGRNTAHMPYQTDFVNAASVSDFNRQLEFRKANYTKVAAPYGQRLRALQEPGATLQLNRSVESMKIELSNSDTSAQRLDFIEEDLLATGTTADLSESSGYFATQYELLLKRVREEIGDLKPVIFFTGGMSRSPYVVEAARSFFPESTVVMGEASLGVVSGLAAYAQG